MRENMKRQLPNVAKPGDAPASPDGENEQVFILLNTTKIALLMMVMMM